MKKSKLRQVEPAAVVAASPARAAIPSPGSRKVKPVGREVDVQRVNDETSERMERPVEVKGVATQKRPKLVARKKPKELPSLFGDLLDPPKVKRVKEKSGDTDGKEKKRSRVKERAEEGGKVGAEGEVKRKKKEKVVQGDVDEIDSIFG